MAMAVREYIIGLDYGDKRVGVGVAHQVARLPRPLTVVSNDERLLDNLRELIDIEGASLVVVGLPRGMDGGYTEQTRKAEGFAKRLQAAIDVPVELADETLTSVDAEAYLPADHVKGDVDAMAACLILERYLAGHPAEGSRSV